jgi:hypothetical protein
MLRAFGNKLGWEKNLMSAVNRNLEMKFFGRKGLLAFQERPGSESTV